MTRIIPVFILVFTSFFCTVVYAQSDMQDVIYCKNGSIIRGIIIEQVIGESLKIQTNDGNVFVFNMSEVEKIAKEKPLTNNIPIKEKTDMCTLGKEDAKVHYKGKGAYAPGIWWTNILAGPVFALIPTAAALTNDLNDRELNAPDRELMKNREYNECYSEQAEDMKNKKAWKNYGISTGVSIAIWTLLILL